MPTNTLNNNKTLNGIRAERRRRSVASFKLCLESPYHATTIVPTWACSHNGHCLHNKYLWNKGTKAPGRTAGAFCCGRYGSWRGGVGAGTGAPGGKPPVIFQSPHLTTPRSRHVPLLGRSASARLRPSGLVTCGLEATPPSGPHGPALTVTPRASALPQSLPASF